MDENLHFENKIDWGSHKSDTAKASSRVPKKSIPQEGIEDTSHAHINLHTVMGHLVSSLESRM